ncbi:MAG: diadenylate cyclase CdaA [Polyangiales bacterium]|nr:diadenylate cyclase CdaA [Myxococcales bacterium]
MITDILAGLRAFFDRDPGPIFLDFADILVVAFLVYRVLLLIRGTRAMQIGVGLALVFSAYWAARRLGLITVWTVLDSFLAYAVLIAVVVFQNDIRRALMRVGTRPLLRGGGDSRTTHVFEEVIKATSALAQKRIGALIVFERDASLDDFVEPGTELDAAVTKDLLYSIFIPSFENPMHDGAVIVREGRVWQAGAFLPLAASPKLDRSLGTRHRAAIGLSEETDAVVVVVSEERGAVSICFNGNIIRDLDSASLREALLGLFYRGIGKRPKTTTRSSRVSSIPPRTSEATKPVEAPKPTPVDSGEGAP